MPRYSALTRLRYALLDLWACIRGAVTPRKRPIAVQPRPRPDPRRCVVMGWDPDPYSVSGVWWGVQRYKAGSWRDGHGWLCVGNGVIPAETMRLFLAAQAVQGGKVNVWDA